MDNNKSQFFGTREEIIKWLDSHNIQNHTINDDLSVDVDGDVDIAYKNLKTIPVNFRRVTGSFWCDGNQLTNLLGSPETVGGDFCSQKNKLTSLIGSPKYVDGSFYCYSNPLISLLEFINCKFKEMLYLDIGKNNFQQKENNFQQKELIQVLKQYYNSKYEHYELTNCQLHDTIKPILEKKLLQQKLIKSENKLKSNKNFI